MLPFWQAMQSSQFPYNFMSGKGKGKDAAPPEPENIPQALLSAFQRFLFDWDACSTFLHRKIDMVISVLSWEILLWQQTSN